MSEQQVFSSIPLGSGRPTSFQEGFNSWITASMISTSDWMTIMPSDSEAALSVLWMSPSGSDLIYQPDVRPLSDPLCIPLGLDEGVLGQDYTWPQVHVSPNFTAFSPDISIQSDNKDDEHPKHKHPTVDEYKSQHSEAVRSIQHSKRRAQNRVAQRTFRARKEAQLRTAQERVEELEAELSKERSVNEKLRNERTTLLRRLKTLGFRRVSE